MGENRKKRRVRGLRGRKETEIQQIHLKKSAERGENCRKTLQRTT